MRLSGLQRQVLSLYRQCLREAKKKPPLVRGNFRDFTRREFRDHQNMDKKDFAAVERLLRTGTRKLELYSSPGIKNISP
ncbi:hypothetical protein GJ744_007786 [Endocarpon pusillum]|uniref:Complex 1 LYR protein domain-containing protein n=1 Tax=Endocarpon pusillum TaxID=364733 RepID=A0A8H7AQR0_9EURO|nr:hypothetical protein GJ744_007786 [Endocarpon pusillum]